MYCPTKFWFAACLPAKFLHNFRWMLLFGIIWIQFHARDNFVLHAKFMGLAVFELFACRIHNVLWVWHTSIVSSNTQWCTVLCSSSQLQEKKCDSLDTVHSGFGSLAGPGMLSIYALVDRCEKSGSHSKICSNNFANHWKCTKFITVNAKILAGKIFGDFVWNPWY